MTVKAVSGSTLSIVIENTLIWISLFFVFTFQQTYCVLRESYTSKSFKNMIVERFSHNAPQHYKGNNSSCFGQEVVFCIVKCIKLTSWVA